MSLSAQQLQPATASIVVDSYSTENISAISIGILIELEPDWYIYWFNPGDSGMPTTIDFDLPDGVGISDVEWPAPKIFEFEGFASYGYDNRVLLSAKLSVPESYNSNSLTIKANISSLICKHVCIPFNAAVSKEISLMNNFVADEETRNLFEQAKNTLPRDKHNLELSIFPENEFIKIVIKNGRINFSEIQSVYFLQYENGLFKNTNGQKFSMKENLIELLVEYDHFKTKELEEVYGLLVFEFTDADYPNQVFEIRESLTD